MPKTDPITGCQVMTQAEFWKAEADTEGLGRTAGDLMHDFYDDIDKERGRTEDEFRNTDTAQDYLWHAVKDWNDGDPETAIPFPVRVLDVLDVNIQIGYARSGERIKARAIRLDNGVEVEDIITASSCTYSGSSMSPPDWDGNVEWEKFKP